MKNTISRKTTLFSLLVISLLFSTVCIGKVSAQDSNCQVHCTVDTGTTAWMLTSTALVLLMIPGLAMFYGGLVRTKNVIGTMMHSFVAMSIIGVLWAVCGYAMSFGSGTGWCGWNWDYFMLKGIDDTVNSAGIPDLVFAMFQGKFAIITPALIAGAFAERVKFRGYCVFIALWSIISK